MHDGDVCVVRYGVVLLGCGIELVQGCYLPSVRFGGLLAVVDGRH